MALFGVSADKQALIYQISKLEQITLELNTTLSSNLTKMWLNRGPVPEVTEAGQ